MLTSGRPWRELSDRGVAAQDRVGEFPTFAAPRIMLGWQLTRLGQFDEARHHLEHDEDNQSDSGVQRTPTGVARRRADTFALLDG